MKNRTLILLAFFVILPFFIYAHFFVSVDSCKAVTNQEEIDGLNKEIEHRKNKIKELEDTIAEYKKSIEKKRTEASSLKNQMSLIESQIDELRVSIDLTKQKISKTQLEIDSLAISIKEKEEVISRQKSIIAKIIQGLHANDQKNFLEIMLTNDNLAEFYNQAKYLENVYSDLGYSVRSIRLAKEDLEDRKREAEERKKTYDSLKKELENKTQDLNERFGSKQRLLTETKASEAKYQTMVGNLQQQYRAIEGEVRAYEEQVRKKLSDQEKFNNINSNSSVLSWPTAGRYITAEFHDPDYPYRKIFEHSGLDIRAAQGTPIRATASGYVGRAKRCTSSSCYGYVLLIHTGNISTLYGHLSSISVNEEQFVERGDLIGYSGGTPGTVGAGPFVTGPHLHFEVRANGIPVNPRNYLTN
jgi:murein DD-endopeptidase MepM/ murein hydrolase activator NlpD